MQRIEPYVPVMVLMLVVALHTLLVVRFDLANSSGGGMAMFSTLDDATQRHVKATLITPDAERVATLDARYDNLLAAASTLPTPQNLRKVGQRVLEDRWVRAASNHALASSSPTKPALTVRAVRIELFKSRYEADRAIVTMRRVTVLEVKP